MSTYYVPVTVPSILHGLFHLLLLTALSSNVLIIPILQTGKLRL